MGRKPASRQETSTERASRARDNKRRHRARQKEYTLELGRRVEETREQGIQVTKEVQLAAQRVTRENAKLRDLLRRTGYTDDVIDAWVREDGCLHGAERLQPVLESMAGTNLQKAPSACDSQRGRELQAQSVSVKEAKPAPMKMPESGECLIKSSSPRELPNEESEVSTAQVSAAVRPKSSSRSRHSESAVAPCKLLTLLAMNPAADLTQVPLSESDNQLYKATESDDDNADGVECSTAYTMLLHHATSHKKMDRIAASLESGCTPSSAGGCKGKKSVVWRVLDEECT